MELSMAGILRGISTLVRPYGILFLGFTPVFAALANGEFDLLHLSILLLIGLLAHVFTFVQNDYCDTEVDKQSKYVTGRPLTTGSITHSTALLLFLGSFFAAVLLAVVFFFSLLSLFVLLLSFLCMTVYNILSKKIPGMECIIGLGVFTLGIFGALSVSDVLSPLAVVICSIGFFQWMFNVGISANLKDVEYDTKLGIRTTPVLFGVHAHGASLKKPMVFIVYAYGIKLVHLVVVALPFLLGYISINIYGFPFPVFCYLFIAILLLYTTHVILTLPLRKRDTLLRYEGIHEGLAFLLYPTVLMSYLVENVGVLPTVLLFAVFISWPLFSLRMLFGKTLIPLE
jgi:4-hydroxybenzoate polyprenyltransferase